MISCLGTEDWIGKMMSSRRIGENNILAFYDHRMGAVCCDPRLLLIPLDDHLVHHGDGVVETCYFEDKRIARLDAHLYHFMRSAASLGITVPCSPAMLKDIVVSVASHAVANGFSVEKGALHLFSGRGCGGFQRDGAECPMPSLYVVATRVGNTGHVCEEDAVTAMIEKGASAFRGAQVVPSGIFAQSSSVSAVNLALLQQEVHSQRRDIAMAFDADECLAGDRDYNFCLIDEKGSLLIPESPAAHRNVTLERALDLIQGALQVRFAAVHEDDIFTATECVAFHARFGCVGIVNFEGQPIGKGAGAGKVGAMTQQFYQLLRMDMQERGTKFK